MKTCWNRGSLGDLSPPNPPTASLTDVTQETCAFARTCRWRCARPAPGRAGCRRLPGSTGLRNAGLAPGPRGAVAPGASRGAQLHRSNQLRTAPRSTEASPGVAGD